MFYRSQIYKATFQGISRPSRILILYCYIHRCTLKLHFVMTCRENSCVLYDQRHRVLRWGKVYLLLYYVTAKLFLSFFIVHIPVRDRWQYIRSCLWSMAFHKSIPESRTRSSSCAWSLLSCPFRSVITAPWVLYMAWMVEVSALRSATRVLLIFLDDLWRPSLDPRWLELLDRLWMPESSLDTTFEGLLHLYDWPHDCRYLARYEHYAYAFPGSRGAQKGFL